MFTTSYNYLGKNFKFKMIYLIYNQIENPEFSPKKLFNLFSNEIFFYYMFNLVYVIPYLVVAPLYFSGNLSLGSITQSSEAFSHVRSDFSIIINYFEKISAFSAGIDRLSTFIHRINEGGWQSNNPGNEGM